MRRLCGSPYLQLVGQTASFNLLTTGLSTLTGVLLARWLGANGRGDYAAVTAYYGLATVFFELGLGSSVVFYASRSRDRAGDYVATATRLLLPLSALAAITSVTLGLTVFSESSPRRLAFLVLPAAIAFGFASAPASFALQALSLRRWSLTRLSQPALFAVLTLIANGLAILTVPVVIVLMAASLACQAALSWAMYFSTAASGRYVRHAVGPMLRFGVLNMSSTAPAAVNARADQIVLALMISSSALGQYAVAVSLSVLATPLVMAFGYVAFPSLARGEQITTTIRMATRGSLLISGFGILVILAAGPFLIPLVLGPGYEAVPRLLVILAPGATVVAVNQVLGDVLRGLGHPGTVAANEWIGVVLTLAGIVTLVPRYGISGAALTSTVTYVVVYLLLRRAVSKYGS